MPDALRGGAGRGGGHGRRIVRGHRQTGCFEIEGPVTEVGDHKVYTTPVEVI
jgi:hypothetical protein